MKAMKIDVRTLFFAFIGVLLFFTSCRKSELESEKAEKEQLQNLTSGQNSSTSAVARDEVTYLEIPEEYLADPDVETILIEQEEVFVTEDGQEVVGYFIAEMTEEGGKFRTIGVSQNLIDGGLVNDDLDSFEKPWLHYYDECILEKCSPPPPHQDGESCRRSCLSSSILDWLLQV